MPLQINGKLLGEIVVSSDRFKDLESLFVELQSEEVRKLNERQKSERVSRHLLQLIQNQPQPSFLLGSVVDYIDRILNEKILEHYTFTSFELWLNQFSGLTPEENLEVRARIVGKRVPRDAYQVLFPIGMGKIHPGSHFVTAHYSPDLDTTVASFWGWIDAFGARVSEGLHLWNLPGGPNLAQIEIPLLFHQIFGESLFTHVPKTRSTLSLSSIDLLSQKGLVKKQTSDSALTIDHERNQNAIVLVDENGYYLGDWRNFDVEGVRQVITSLNQCLKWFENNLYLKLTSLFAKEDLSLRDLPEFIRSVFGTRIRDSEPARELSEKQKKHTQDYLCKVLNVKNGLDSTFEEFATAMKQLAIFDFKEFIDLVESLDKSTLFDKTGALVENRPRIFHMLEKIILGLDKAIQSVRSFVERLDVALNIKTEVFGYFPQVISYRADVEEIRNKMGTYPYLTVISPDKEGRSIPMGIVHSSDVHKQVLGTVTLRDFCNREETKIPSYLEVISIIDHHKSALNTLSPACVSISDAQSANSLVAEIAFQINDAYSTMGMDTKSIEKQIAKAQQNLKSIANKRILQRLLQRLIAAEKSPAFFIDPNREFTEYLHFIYAILDDTDLLTKASLRDVECVASLLNRLKSLALKEEVEVISFDDLPRDENFVARAAQRILQNEEMYSLYRKIYLAKENGIEENFKLCVAGKPSNVFADTKEQNGCCRVGQTKIFAKNFPTFDKAALALRRIWLEESKLNYREKNEVDLYLHMVTTLAGAEELFAGKVEEYKHKDEIWIWVPSTEPATEHLKSFLNSFRSSPKVASGQMEVEFLGENSKELEQIFVESFAPVPRRSSIPEDGKGIPIAVLHFTAGTLNSRKAMISPCLPRLIN